MAKIPAITHAPSQRQILSRNRRLRLEQGKRYRLSFNNDTGDIDRLHLHRHTFEVINVGGKPMAGLMKAVASVARKRTAEVDFVADEPRGDVVPLPHAIAEKLQWRPTSLRSRLRKQLIPGRAPLASG